MNVEMFLAVWISGVMCGLGLGIALRSDKDRP